MRSLVLLHSLTAAVILLTSFALSLPQIGTGSNDFNDSSITPRARIAQQIAIASYIDPGNGDAWGRLAAYPTQKVPLLVANVLNGPDVVLNPAWKDVINSAKATSKVVLGYVRTGYLGLGSAQFKTRLGSGEIGDWVAQIERDIDTWYELYGPYGLKGIFLDEGWWDCGASNAYATIYKYINDYTKRRYPNAITVLNPGSPVGQCYENTADTLITFEHDYDTYTTSYQGLNWVPQDPRKIWHIVYNVPAPAVPGVVQLSNDRGAGFIQLTDDNLPNPYDNLPADTYMQSELSAIDGGSVSYTPPIPWPAGPGAGLITSLAAPKVDYSSVRLTWNAAANALGYNIYISSFKGQTNFLIASTPPSLRNLTIGGLPPATSLTFFVKAIGGNGNLALSSNSVTVTTLALPGGKSINNLTSTPSPSSTIYKANVYVPYGFLRLFIWDMASIPTSSNPSLCTSSSTGATGWPIEYATGRYVCGKYMVEGSTLYKYTGTGGSITSWPAWSWDWIGPVTVNFPAAGQGYTVTWNVTVGTSTMETRNFVVQGDGLGPFINAIKGFVLLPPP